MFSLFLSILMNVADCTVRLSSALFFIITSLLLKNSQALSHLSELSPHVHQSCLLLSFTCDGQMAGKDESREEFRQ